jgi:hypothetical protein
VDNPGTFARNLRSAILTGLALVVLAPLMQSVGQINLVWPVALAGIAAGVVAFTYSFVVADCPVRGAGPLLFGSLLMPAWIWFSSFALFDEDVVQLCGRAVNGSSPNMVISHSLIPPGVLCYPDGYASLPVLATPLDTFVQCMVWLLVVLTPLAASLWLVLRTTKITDPL